MIAPIAVAICEQWRKRGGEGVELVVGYSPGMCARSRLSLFSSATPRSTDRLSCARSPRQVWKCKEEAGKRCWSGE
ncbi:hypothetical protein NQZ68_004196 [Dissostichus eleginoides]|nr:hypothetical protein NQZ68_004196 [Dissostichus eleginoides]